MPADPSGWPYSSTPGFNSGMPPLTTPTLPPPNPKKKLMIIAAAVVVVIVLAVASYFMFFKKDSNGSADEAAQKSNATSRNATEMATLNKVTLTPPATVNGFTERTTGISTIKDFVSTDNTCEFIVGTVGEAQLPGATMDAMIQPQLKQLRDAGATVVGPKAIDALILKDAAGKQYSMPTIEFEFSQGAKHATVHYSAVILKSKDRAVINRTCVNATGAVDLARLRTIDTTAKQVVVGVQ
jgi:hypothetical protein